jgi:four helix bundle protein
MLRTIRMSFANEIQHRLYQFALAAKRFCRTLPNTDEATEVAGQLRRSSSGASANYRATRRARSRREWLAKLGTVVEELDESKHWLTMLRDSEIKQPPQNQITECTELRAILAKSCATARRRQRPPNRPDA